MGWIEKLKEIKDRIFGTKTKMLNEKNKKYKYYKSRPKYAKNN